MKFNVKNTKKIALIIVLSLGFLMPSCEKSESSIIDTEVDEIDAFIWNGLRLYYLWKDEVPNLNPDNFSSEQDIVRYLNSAASHEDLFYDLLYQYGTVDKWSWIVDDYVALEEYFQGITTSFGYEYGLVDYDATDNIFAYVQYVVPGSPADLAGMQRGDIIVKVDDQQLTESNYADLLFGRSNYKVSYAEHDGTSLNETGESDELTAIEIEENPIHYSEIIDVDGIKVAYLVYNGFTSTYDHDLNSLFETYQTEGVQELILDLRYNGGGSMQTATYLASMIYGTNTTEIFSKVQYNDELQLYLEAEYGTSFFDTYFASEVAAAGGNAKADINSLDLTRLYVLTTKGTASASELIINGLNPYIDVVLVGTNTHGKYVGSITVKDYNDNGVVNPNHFWAMQPIVLKTTNAVGYSDFVDGFAPDVTVQQDYYNILPFGDQNDAFLKAALDHIRGAGSVQKTIPHQFISIADSKDGKRFGKEMYAKEIK